MPIALTCTCGARLEIDDKFAGQVIPCPDCNKPLATALPPAQPRQTSGLALSSLLVALVGAFTVVGTLAAVLLGMIALRQIRAHSREIAGRKYALAGITLGILFTGVSLWVYLSSGVFGLDGFFRELEWAGKLDYADDLLVDYKIAKGFTLKRAARGWGTYRHMHNTGDGETDDLILVQPRADAYLACMSLDRFEKLTPEEQLDEALRRFKSSELVGLLGRFKGKTPKLDFKVSAPKLLGEPDKEVQEVAFDLRLGGFTRTFLMVVIRKPTKIHILTAATRRGRFAGMEKELRGMIESFQAD